MVVKHPNFQGLLPNHASSHVQILVVPSFRQFPLVGHPVVQKNFGSLFAIICKECDPTTALTNSG